MSEEVMRWSLHQVPATKAPKMLERRDGMWVLHEDHQKALAASQARLFEAVKVLQPLVQYLEDDGPILASDIETLSNAKAFLATLGEENE